MDIYNLSLLKIGNFERVWEEFDAKTMRRAGRGAGHDQTIFPRRWQRIEEDLFGEVARTAVATLRLVTVHADDRYAHQDIRHHSDQSR